jgi:hypothetical protein
MSPASRAASRRWALGYVVGFAILSGLMAILSIGFLEADGITHFLYAEASLAYPWILTDVWGRPIVKLLHALPAAVPLKLGGLHEGLVMVRWTSLAVALVGAWLSYLVARDLPLLQRRPDVAAVCVLGSPLVFLHSFAELTELPFGLVCIAALLAYARRRWWLLALLGGLLPAARPEGIGFILMIATGLVLHRRWLALPWLLVGPLGWATAGWLISGQPGVWPMAAVRWLLAAWPYSEESAYASGPLLKFVGMLPAAVGPGLFPAVLVGWWLSLRVAWPLPTRRNDHAGRTWLLVGLVTGIVLVVHSLLHWTGRMASSGDVRYLVAVWPFWGLLAAGGLIWLCERLAIERMTRAAVLLAAVPMILLQLAYPVVPLGDDNGATAAKEVAAWYQSPESAELRYRFPHTRVDHPVFRLVVDIGPFSGGSRQLVQDRPPGVLYLWHEVFSNYNADSQYTVSADVPPAAGWLDVTPNDFPQGWRVFVSEPANDPA